MLEIECKYIIESKEVFKNLLQNIPSDYSIKCGKTKLQEDLYFDDKEFRLMGQDISLRIRETGIYELVLKLPTDINTERIERTVEVNNSDIHDHKQYIQEVYSQNLTHALTVINNRTKYIIHKGGTEFAELLLDDVIYKYGGYTEKDLQIELELIEGDKKEFYRLCKHLHDTTKGLVNNQTSKYKRGLQKLRRITV